MKTTKSPIQNKLSAAEKLQIEDSVNRSISWLHAKRMRELDRLIELCESGMPFSFDSDERSWRRMFELSRATVASRIQRRNGRRLEIYHAAKKIAEETGAPFDEIHEGFLETMQLKMII